MSVATIAIDAAMKQGNGSRDRNHQQHFGSEDRVKSGHQKDTGCHHGCQSEPKRKTGVGPSMASGNQTWRETAHFCRHIRRKMPTPAITSSM